MTAGDTIGRFQARTTDDRLALLKSGGDVPPRGLGNGLTLITGPSKTADIELTMVHGAHGPRELYLYVISPPDI